MIESIREPDFFVCRTCVPNGWTIWDIGFSTLMRRRVVLEKIVSAMNHADLKFGEHEILPGRFFA